MVGVTLVSRAGYFRQEIADGRQISLAVAAAGLARLARGGALGANA